jgi:predicted hotdog family 3-hydroxylacyl-ACP dehydratase
VKTTREEHIDLKNFLPHRKPMLMVTRLIGINEDSVHTEFVVAEDCVFVKNGMLSETGLIENAAQTCSAIVGQSYFDKEDLKGEGNKLVGYISAIKKIELFGLPKLGMVITTKASLVSRFDTGAVTICSIDCSTFNSDNLIVACTLNFIIHEVE